jgi:hypothetical protein
LPLCANERATNSIDSDANRVLLIKNCLKAECTKRITVSVGYAALLTVLYYLGL